MAINNRVTQMMGMQYPIIQAPMGWIARSQLASAVSAAGGLGMIETSSGENDAIVEEIRKMKTLTDKPFCVNIAQAFIRDPSIIDMIIAEGVKTVTTSAGSPKKFTKVLKEAGLNVFHVVPTLEAAQKAVDAGVDGLIVEGGEGGGFKNPKDVSTMVLLPLVRSKLDVPLIAAGGICDGATMAAAFALGAEGVQMGTRMVSALESPVHQNWKQAIVDAPDTGTVMIKPNGPGAALRALRTETSEALERGEGNPMATLGGGVKQVYFEGKLEDGLALTGQVAGRIEAVEPVATIIERTMQEFEDTLSKLSSTYL
ncbi:MAG: nitronate monooxygenase [Alphaproteobacteria bacterium]